MPRKGGIPYELLSVITIRSSGAEERLCESCICGREEASGQLNATDRVSGMRAWAAYQVFNCFFGTGTLEFCHIESFRGA